MDYAEYFKEHSSPLEPEPTGEKVVLKSFDEIEAVVFDIYGTLIISAAGDISLAGEAAPDTAMERALCHAGLNCETAEALARYRDVVGKHQDRIRESGTEYPEVEIRDVWQEVVDPIGAGKLQDEMIEEMAVVYECAANPVWPMPGLRETFRELRERNLTLGIVSNAQFYTPYMFPAFLDATLPDLGFDEDRMIFSYEFREGKPSRRLYAELKIRGMNPEKTLYIGNDMLKDILPSGAEGFQTVLFAGDQRSLRWRRDDERLRDCEPDAIITSLDQITQLLP